MFYISYMFKDNPLVFRINYIPDIDNIDEAKAKILSHSSSVGRNLNTYFLREQGRPEILFACVAGNEIEITPELVTRINKPYHYVEPK